MRSSSLFLVSFSFLIFCTFSVAFCCLDCESVVSLVSVNNCWCFNLFYLVEVLFHVIDCISQVLWVIDFISQVSHVCRHCGDSLHMLHFISV